MAQKANAQKRINITLSTDASGHLERAVFVFSHPVIRDTKSAALAGGESSKHIYSNTGIEVRRSQYELETKLDWRRCPINAKLLIFYLAWASERRGYSGDHCIQGDNGSLAQKLYNACKNPKDWRDNMFGVANIGKKESSLINKAVDASKQNVSPMYTIKIQSHELHVENIRFYSHEKGAKKDLEMPYSWLRTHHQSKPDIPNFAEVASISPSSSTSIQKSIEVKSPHHYDFGEPESWVIVQLGDMSGQLSEVKLLSEAIGLGLGHAFATAGIGLVFQGRSWPASYTLCRTLIDTVGKRHSRQWVYSYVTPGILAKFRDMTDPSEEVYLGSIIEVAGDSPEARRRKMLKAADALVVVGGHSRTEDLCDLMEFDTKVGGRSVIYVPCCGGVGRDRFNEYLSKLDRRLRSRVSRLAATNISSEEVVGTIMEALIFHLGSAKMTSSP